MVNLIRIPVNPSSRRVSAPFIADPPENTKDNISYPHEQNLFLNGGTKNFAVSSLSEKVKNKIYAFK